jgi:hypothetical protein
MSATITNFVVSLNTIQVNWTFEGFNPETTLTVYYQLVGDGSSWTTGPVTTCGALTATISELQNSTPYNVALTVTGDTTHQEEILWVPSEGKFLYLTNEFDGYITALTDDMARLLGFVTGIQNNVSPFPTDGSVSSVTGWNYYVKSSFVVDMSKNDYIFLGIPELSYSKFQETWSSAYGALNSTGLFTGIPLDVAPNTIKIFKNSDYPISVSYDPPIAQVSKLTMNWYDKNRNFINFQGMEDNAVIFRFTVAKDPPKELEWEFDEEKFIDLRELPPPPIPKVIKEKKTWGRWFILLVIISLATLWISKKQAAWPGPYKNK